MQSGRSFQLIWGGPRPASPRDRSTPQANSAGRDWAGHAVPERGAGEGFRMFTGIVSDVGQIIDIAPSGDLRRLRIASAYEAETIPIGASIANSGACLTVDAVEPLKGGSAIAFDVGAET